MIYAFTGRMFVFVISRCIVWFISSARRAKVRQKNCSVRVHRNGSIRSQLLWKQLTKTKSTLTQDKYSLSLSFSLIRGTVFASRRYQAGTLCHRLSRLAVATATATWSADTESHLYHRLRSRCPPHRCSHKSHHHRRRRCCCH